MRRHGSGRCTPLPMYLYSSEASDKLPCLHVGRHPFFSACYGSAERRKDHRRGCRDLRADFGHPLRRRRWHRIRSISYSKLRTMRGDAWCRGTAYGWLSNRSNRELASALERSDFHRQQPDSHINNAGLAMPKSEWLRATDQAGRLLGAAAMPVTDHRHNRQRHGSSKHGALPSRH